MVRVVESINNDYTKIIDDESRYLCINFLDWWYDFKDKFDELQSAIGNYNFDTPDVSDEAIYLKYKNIVSSVNYIEKVLNGEPGSDRLFLK